MLNPPNITNHIKRKNVLQLQIATKLPQPLDGLILLRIRLGKLSIRTWFGIAPHLTVEILFGISFTDCFIRGIFLVERKVFPWRSQPVAKLVHKRNLQDTRISNNISLNQAQVVDQNLYEDIAYAVVRVAQ